ncbi:MAG: HU family DNA-binding protein [Planctomycetota bacterium]
MRKADLVLEVQKQLGAECSRTYAARAVEALLQAIERGLKRDKEVQIVGFGTFTVRQREARAGRNPQNGTTIQIKASRTVGFRACATLRANL